MQPGPLSQTRWLRPLVTDSLSTAELIHSYLVELTWDPTFSQDQSLAAFNDSAQHELHHLAALRGALTRYDRNDPTAWSSIGLNLARVLHRRRESMKLAKELSSAVRQDTRGRAILALLEQDTRKMQPYLPLIRQTIQATGWQKAVPELFS